MNFVDFITEMQEPNRDVEEKFNDRKTPALEHIYKFVKYKDFFNNKKHIKNTVKFIEILNRLKPYKKFTMKELLNMLDVDQKYIDDVIRTKKFIRDYGGLEVARSDEETLEVMVEISKHLQEVLYSKPQRAKTEDHTNLNGLQQYLGSFDLSDYR